jgi:hypothetical protein
MPDVFEQQLRDALRAEAARLPFLIDASTVERRLMRSSRNARALLLSVGIAAIGAILVTAIYLSQPADRSNLGSSSSGAASSSTVTMPSAPSGASATPSPTPHPIQREDAAWTAREGRLYVAGGRADGALASVSMLDFAAPQWVDLPELPEAWRNAALAVLPDGGLLLFGGRHEGEVTDTTFGLDAGGRQWSVRQPMPHAQADMAVAVHDGRVYLFGGSEEGQRDVLIYDLVADTWRSGAAIPSAVTRGAAAVVGESIYLFGGHAEDEAVGPLAYRYDPAADRWERLADMPLAGTSMSATVVGDRIWVIARDWTWFSQTEADPAPDQRFGRVLVLDAGTGEWSVSPQRVNPLAGGGWHMAVPLDDGDIHVIVASPLGSTSNTIRTTEP